MKRLGPSQLENTPIYPGLLDSHIHLDSESYAEDLDDCLARAERAGLSAMLFPSTDLDSARRIQQLCRTRSTPSLRLYGAAGIHPHQAASFGPDRTPAELRSLLTSDFPWKAIGETGLECHYDFCPLEVQVRSLEAHLDLAEELGLPLILHCRQAEPILYDQLRNRSLQGVVHCFTGSWEWASKFLDLGLYLGIGGIASLPRAAEVHEVARRVPADRWLLETDGPYLSPVPFRGYRNESCLLPWVVEAVARLRGETPQEATLQSQQNARRLFSLPASESASKVAHLPPA